MLQLPDIPGEQGWSSGESTHLPPMWLRFDSQTWHYVWVEFLVVSCPCSKGFSPGTPVFFPPQKPTFPIQFDLKTVDRRATLWNPLKFPLFINLFIYHLFYLTIGYNYWIYNGIIIGYNYCTYHPFYGHGHFMALFLTCECAPAQ